MSSITDIQLFNALKQKLGEKEAEELVSFVRSTVEEKFDEATENLATKLDLADVRNELKQDISQAKVDMIKWFVAFFITIILLIVGLYFK